MMFREPKSGLMQVLRIVGLLVVVLSVHHSAEVSAHSLVTSAHSVSVGPKGNRYVTMSFGLIRQPNSQLSAEWICPDSFGSNGQALDRVVIAHAQGLFILDDGLLTRSSDEGCTWTKETLPAEVGKVVELVSTDAALWVRTEEPAALLRREAAGWVELKSPANQALSSLRAGPGLQDLWVTGEADKPISLLSSDGGDSWTVNALPKTGIPDAKFTALARHPKQATWLVLRVRAAMGLDQLWMSVDAGASWQAAFAPKPGQDIAEAVWLADEASGTLLVGSMSAGIWRSTDGGQQFSLVPDAPRVGCLRRFGAEVYGCSDEFINGAALMSSTDKGKSWSAALCFGSVAKVSTCATLCVPQWEQTRQTHSLASDPTCLSPPSQDMDVSDGQGSADVSASDGAYATFDAGQGGGVVVAKRDGCQAQPIGNPADTMWLVLFASLLLIGRRCHYVRSSL